MDPGAQQLVRRLQEAGLFALQSLPGDGGLRAYDWEKMAPQLPPETQELWRFFLIGGSLPVPRLQQLAGEGAVGFLRAHNLLRDDNGSVSLGPLSLVYYKRLAFFIERSAQPRSYFGEDTKALMTLLPVNFERGRCLGLYPGSGAQVLPLAGSPHVQFTFAGGQYQPEVVKANLLMNGAEISPRFLKIAGRSKTAYEVMVAAPPSTFEPPGVPMPALIAGGRDGLGCVRKVLDTAESALIDAGELCMIFIFYAVKDNVAAREKLKGFLDGRRLDYRVVLCSKHSLEPGVPVFNMLLGSAAAGRPQEAPAIAEKMARHLKNLEVDTAYLVKGTFRKTAGTPRRELIDFSELYYGAWTF